MLSITVQPDLLSEDQRGYVADFIRNFPAIETTTPQVVIPSFTVVEDEDRTAEEAFGITDSPVDNAESEPASAAKVMPFPASNSESAPNCDKNGLPWDARIHTSSRSLNKNGTWRYKRAVDQDVIVLVESELRSLMAVPVAPPPPPAAVPPPPVVQAVPMPAQPASPNAFIDLISRASELILAKKLTQAQLDEILNAAAVPSLSLLANRLDLVPEVLKKINDIAMGQMA